MCTSICQNITLNKVFDGKFLNATTVFRQPSTNMKGTFKLFPI